MRLKSEINYFLCLFLLSICLAIISVGAETHPGARVSWGTHVYGVGYSGMAIQQNIWKKINDGKNWLKIHLNNFENFFKKSSL